MFLSYWNGFLKISKKKLPAAILNFYCYGVSDFIYKKKDDLTIGISSCQIHTLFFGFFLHFRSTRLSELEGHHGFFLCVFHDGKKF